MVSPERTLFPLHVSVLTALVLVGVAGAGASAQPRRASGSIDAVVTDSSLVPLADADVSIQRTAVKLATGQDGRFYITPIPTGQYRLTIQKLGFRSVVCLVDIVPDDTIRLSVVLERGAPLLNAVVVTGMSRSLRLAQFDRRRELGGGQFLTEAEIGKRNSTFATELVRTFKGVNVKTYPGGGGQMQYFATSTRSGTTEEYKPRVPRGLADETIKGCPMQVYVDGVPMPTPFNLDELPSPKDLGTP